MSKRRAKTLTALQFRIPHFEPATPTQARFSAQFDEEPEGIINLIGWAGTGKTYIAVHKALEALQRGDVRKILLVRNAVSARDLGFLPGTEHDKTLPFQSPFMATINKICGRDDAYGILKQHGLIEFACTSYEQGKTHDDTCVIVDECQNLPFLEFDLMTTRLGEGSRIIFCGDLIQDYVTRGHEKTGVGEYLDICDMMRAATTLHFTKEDIVRSGLVRDYIIAREERFAGER